MSEIPIVDENDTIISYKEKSARGPHDIYRVSALWITNSKGEILIARRALSKKLDPGQWGPAVAGTVEKGETYEGNIVKEAEEELGLENIQPTLGPLRGPSGDYGYFGQWFTLQLDRAAADFEINDEVEEVMWITKQDLLNWISKNPKDFITDMEEVVNLLS